jgi:ankyrin repeat protein
MEMLEIKFFSDRSHLKNQFFMVLMVLFLWAFPASSFAFNTEKVLYKAIQDNDKNQIDSLRKQGVNINKGNYLNNVALSKNQEIFKLLLDMGGDINQAQEGPPLNHEGKNDVGGKTPLCLTVSNFLSSKKEMNAIKGSDEWVAFLLNHGADPNKKCYGKYTPIMMVAGKGADTEGLAQWDRLEMAMRIIVLLMKNGADLDARIDGVTAMDYAHESQNLDLVMFLKSLGATE